ncbi:MAG: DNA methyltransferase [Methanomassiliicoccales archaeon]|nr:DNA methyltransferase [Methanomassiliicoccales archaeon]
MNERSKDAERIPSGTSCQRKGGSVSSPGDYSARTYLSAGEVSDMLGIGLDVIYRSVRNGTLLSSRSASGQHRFNITDVEAFDTSELQHPKGNETSNRTRMRRSYSLRVKGTLQRIIASDSRAMSKIADGSVNLAITSPPYFDTKMYSGEGTVDGDLGNVHDLDEWLFRIGMVWAEVFRVLQPGRKFFLNIMNLPLRTGGSFRTLNLAGKSIDLCEAVGFVFRRDIVWQKTNSVRAHFGTYPYPGGILINNAHEFILEFEKPAPRGYRKYSHVGSAEKEKSILDKDFWIALKKSDVWLMNPERSGTGRKHVAPFSIELPSRLVKAYSYVGETVLDPFAGSGTTLAASAMLGRNGIGYDINPSFVRQAYERLLLMRS